MLGWKDGLFNPKAGSYDPLVAADFLSPGADISVSIYLIYWPLALRTNNGGPVIEGREEVVILSLFLAFSGLYRPMSSRAPWVKFPRVRKVCQGKRT